MAAPTFESDAALAAYNAEVKAKLEAQGAETSGGLSSSELQESADALDALANAATASKQNLDEEGNPVVDPVADPVADPVVELSAEDKAAQEAKAAADAESAAAQEKADEIFKDSPKLPPHASPKSSEAFNAIKAKAAQEIAAREARIAAAEAKLVEAEEKLKTPADEALTKELEDHRSWRAKLDVDADPKFKEFDKSVAATHEFIYAQLKKSPAITDSVIEQIKKYGGPEFVNMDKIFALTKDPLLQRIVESKIAEVEMTKFNKEQAVKATKDNIAAYLAERQRSTAENATAHNRATESRLAEYTSKLTWLAPKPVDAKADEPTRKAAEEHNAFVAETKQQLDSALKDDSVEMRAIMLTATAQLLYLQRLRAQETAEKAALTKELTEAKTRLAKLAAVGTSRLRESAAPAGGRLEQKPKGPDITLSSSEALDNIAKQIAEERARKASA